MSRGLGRWQNLILDELERQPGFALTKRVQRALGRSMTTAEYKAAHRAARTLARRGRCQAGLLWSDGRAKTFIAPVDFAYDGATLADISVDSGTSGARGPYRGSLRDIAQATGRSHTTVWRARRAAGGP